MHTPIKQRPGGRCLAVDNRAHNALLSALRAQGERAIALLETRWKALRHLALDPLAHQRHHRRRPRPHPETTQLSLLRNLTI